MARRWNRCCCGRIEGIERADLLPVVINDMMHELLGPDGAFCGPVKDHTIRDLTASLECVRIGGNHLANVLITALGGNFAKKYPPTTPAAEALESIPAPWFDIWCCWRAIMSTRKED